jgi:hypothetical protein
MTTRATTLSLLLMITVAQYGAANKIAAQLHRRVECLSGYEQCGSATAVCILNSSTCCGSLFNDSFSCRSGEHCEDRLPHSVSNFYTGTHTVTFSPQCCKDGYFACGNLQNTSSINLGCCKEGHICNSTAFSVSEDNRYSCVDPGTFHTAFEVWMENESVDGLDPQLSLVRKSILIAGCSFLGSSSF